MAKKEEQFITSIETVIRGEVSDANIQGYLRAASQIEEVWQQIDEKLTQLITQGMAPWDAYAHLRYSQAFIRAARTYQVFVKELLSADAAFEPTKEGYLPHITYDQANVLCSQLQPALQYTMTALNDPAYVPDTPFPLILGPRIEFAKLFLAQPGHCHARTATPRTTRQQRDFPEVSTQRLP